MESDSLLSLLVYLFLLLASAYFSGIETATLFSNRLRIKSLAKKNKKAKIVNTFQDNPESFLSVVLVGNNIVNIFLASYSAYVFFLLSGEKGIFYSSILTTFLIIIFGEIAPKSIASNIPEKFALFFAPLTNIVYKLLHPIIKYFIFIVTFILKALGIKKQDNKRLTPDDMKSIFSIAQEEGVLEREKAFIYKNIWDISEITCREIMVPKSQVISLDANIDLKSCLEIVHSNKYSRYPVYEGQSDNIIGVVHSKDIMDFWGNEESFNLRKIMRAPLFVPDIIYADEVFELLKRNRVHLGAVVDEYGNFEGIVTMEDIIEEIFGEIRDEHDFDEELMLRLINENTYMASGNTPIRSINSALNTSLPEEENTLAGLIFYITGKIPKKDEEVKYNGLLFKIKNIKGNRIKRVLIKKISEENDSFI
ncbi:MAG: hemolysin family protein [Proteobacteria bacterium]|nr:hemolysin family protein [Pseudomonadota bacterium]